MNRAARIAIVLSLVAACPSPASAAEPIELKSPDATIRLEIATAGDRVTFAVYRDGKAVLESSPLGLVVDGTDLGRGSVLGTAERYAFDERYAMRGVHSLARNHGNGLRVPVRHSASGTDYTIEVRAFDDGVAVRTIVPGGGRPRVVDEATAFRLPEGSTVWYHDLHGHYEGVHAQRAIADVSDGDWAAPPLTVKLPGSGYAAITEAVLGGFPGMALQAAGPRAFAVRLGHRHPASYPFTLRYKDDVDRVARPAALDGAITSPWRVVMIGADLNALVNCDIVTNLAPPPDPALFPDGPATPWIKPGRAVWKFLDGGQSNLEGMKEFSRLAGELGFEYNVIEGFWQKWTDAQLREFVAESKTRGVGIWLWKHSKELRTPDARRAFFERLQRAGAVGAKIDFFDHEAKEIVDLYPVLLREAAERRLMLDFHGANKPTGEARTWPNELGREGIYGLEHKGMKAWSRHNATVPFTRLLAGHADYTPVLFGERRRETSWAHQLATAVVMTEPLLVYAAHPRSLLESPAVELVKSIPSVWDETIVLPPSEIGVLAVFARRHRDQWFLGIVNGPEPRTLRLTPSFLAEGTYRLLAARDQPDEPAAVKMDEGTAAKADPLEIELRGGGGFVARLTRP